MMFRCATIEQTLFHPVEKAQSVVTERLYIHPRVIHVAKQPNEALYTVNVHNIQTDERYVLDKVCCYRNHIISFACITSTTIDVIERTRHFKLKHNLPSPIGYHMDIYMNDDNVLVAITDGIVVHMFIHDAITTVYLRETSYECEEITVLNECGDFIIRNKTSIYASSKNCKFDAREVRMIVRLNRIERWCVCYNELVIFMDTDALYTWTIKGYYKTIELLDAGDLIGTYINTTASQITFTPDERVCIYEYKGRLCTIQLTAPYAMYPTTVIKGLRDEFEIIISIVYVNLYCIRVYTTKGVYMFGDS